MPRPSQLDLTDSSVTVLNEVAPVVVGVSTAASSTTADGGIGKLLGCGIVARFR